MSAQLQSNVEALRTGPEATALAFELADSIAICDIECFCQEVGKRGSKGWWYDTTEVGDDDRQDVRKALLYLGLRGLLLCREDNAEIVSIVRN